MPRVLAVSTGRVAPLFVDARGARESLASGIAKSAISTLAQPDPVAVGPMGLSGDEQADLSVHGGLDKALYLYPREHLDFWATVRSQARLEPSLAPGAFGENLLVEGLLETELHLGDTLDLGEVLLRVESPRQPCFKFNARMGFAWASKMMIQSGFTGFYCSVLRSGSVRAGDAVHIRPGERAVSVLQSHRLRNRTGQEPLFRT
jgi:MOSC domain-containing protein YiiM